MESQNNTFLATRECTSCRGTGVKESENYHTNKIELVPCRVCNGTGVVQVTRERV